LRTSSPPGVDVLIAEDVEEPRRRVLADHAHEPHGVKKLAA
jgi:hypothetical protein